MKVGNKGPGNTNKNQGTRSDTAHTPKNRPERKPFNLGASLTVPPWVADKYGENGKNFFYYFFVDKNVEAAVAAYYEFAVDESGAKVVHPAKDGEAKMTLMLLPMEYREEDLRLKRDRNQAIIAEGTPLKAQEGFKEYEAKA